MRGAGWRWVRSLEVALEALLRTGRAATVAEIHARARDRAPRLSAATLQHALDVLLQHGIVRNLGDPRGPRRIVYRGPGAGPRPQVVVARCRACGRREEVASTALVRLKSELWRKLGYELADPAAELVGVCPSCG